MPQVLCGVVSLPVAAFGTLMWHVASVENLFCHSHIKMNISFCTPVGFGVFFCVCVRLFMFSLIYFNSCTTF